MGIVFSGTSDNTTKTDCRTEGCGKNSECIREQAFFVCRCLPGFSGAPEIGCLRGESAEANETADILYLKLYTVHRLFAHLEHCALIFWSPWLKAHFVNILHVASFT